MASNNSSNNNKSHTLPITGNRVKPALPPRPIRSRSMTFTGTNTITNNNTSSTNRSSYKLTSRLRGNSVDALLIDLNEPIGNTSNDISSNKSSSHSLASNYEQQHSTMSPDIPVVEDNHLSNINDDHTLDSTLNGQSKTVNDIQANDNNNSEGKTTVNDSKEQSNNDDKGNETHSIVNNDLGQKSTEEQLLSLNETQSNDATVKVEEDKVKPNRPPMPSRPPPPLTRPPRPFAPPPSRPPPSQTSPSHPPPSISEAKLARKRPPPTPPLIIDSRSSPDHTPHSQRTFKSDSSPKHSPKPNTKSTSAIPKRPPPPTVHISPVNQLITVTSEDISNNGGTCEEEASKERSSSLTDFKTNKSNDSHLRANHQSVSSPHLLAVIKEDRVSSEEEEEEEEEEREIEEKKEMSIEHHNHSPTYSPHQSKKLLGKVTQSIRTFSQRRIKTVRENSGDRSPRNWKRVFSTRATKSQPDIPTQDNDKYPDKLTTGVVDPVLVQCVAYLNKEDVLKEPGLFRIPGDLSVIKRLRSQFIAGEFVDFTDIMDPNIITGLLKVYFREKLHPLISDRLSLSKVVTAAKNKDVDSFKETLDDLDDVTLASLRMLSELFKKITEYSEVNHMTSGILATSCGPSFFPNTQPSNANNLVKFLTDHCDELFAT